MLIDGDNAQAAIAEEMPGEVARYGTATIKRAYGDWTTTHLAGWKETLHNLAIQPVQQFRYTVGKNANRFGADHRRDGPVALGHGRRLLPGFLG